MKILLIIPALIAATALFMVVKNSLTPSNLGVTEGKLAPVPKSPNAVSSQTDDPEKRVAPFPFKADLHTTKASIKQVLRAYGNIDIKSETEDYIHAVNTTPKMKFNDDLEFYFNEKEGVVHFRSASRTGYSDMGLNRERYNALMELFTTQ
jgi:uncharacterized protein (DUF1499 family)